MLKSSTQLLFMSFGTTNAFLASLSFNISHSHIPIWISLHLPLCKYLLTPEILEIMFRPNAFYCGRGLICNYRAGSSIMMYFITQLQLWCISLHSHLSSACAWAAEISQTSNPCLMNIKLLSTSNIIAWLDCTVLSIR